MTVSLKKILLYTRFAEPFVQKVIMVSFIIPLIKTLLSRSRLKCFEAGDTLKLSKI